MNQSSSTTSQHRIWQVVQLIPVGNVTSYGKVADLAGLPGRARLVGKVLGQVPQEGFQGQPVPWYRVLRASGELAFPVGSSAFSEQKARLLEEGVFVKGKRVQLKEYEWQINLFDLLTKLTF